MVIRNRNNNNNFIALFVKCIMVVGVLLLSSFVKAIPFEVDITVDNSYALYYGTDTAATTFIGSDNSWATVETYQFNLPDDHYFYVVTESDLAVAQGLLAQFTNLDTNDRFYSQDPQWEVAATGLRGSAPYSGTAADIATLTTQIGNANAGLNLSNGWTNTSAGNLNGTAPWGTLSGIDPQARWVWHNASSTISNPTIGGFNHDEYLIFRIAIDSKPIDVSSPGMAAMFLFGLAGVFCLRRKTKAGAV